MATGLPRIVPAGGVVFQGHYIPARVFFSFCRQIDQILIRLQTEISVPAFTIQHDESIGGDPDVFRPERWLESPERRKNLLGYLLAFGKGPRACVSTVNRYLLNSKSNAFFIDILLSWEESEQFESMRLRNSISLALHIWKLS
jgi:benzoate 4-monooxygenase